MNRRKVLKGVGGVGTMTALPVATVHAESDDLKADDGFIEEKLDFIELTVEVDHSVEDAVTGPSCRFDVEYLLDGNRVIVSRPGALERPVASTLIGTHDRLLPSDGRRSVTPTSEFNPHGSNVRLKNHLPPIEVSKLEDGFLVKCQGIEQELTDNTAYTESFVQENGVRRRVLDYDDSSERFIQTDVDITITLKPRLGATVLSHESKRIFPLNDNWEEYAHNLQRSEAANKSVAGRSVDIYRDLDIIVIDPRNRGEKR